MLTVYAIRYDEENNVLHAATGDNKQAEAVGLTFDASKEGFGKLLQKWNGEDRVVFSDVKINYELFYYFFLFPRT